MTDVEKSEILHIWHVCDVESVAIYAKFMQFSCGEKLSPKEHLWRRNDKYQVNPAPVINAFVVSLCFNQIIRNGEITAEEKE